MTNQSGYLLRENTGTTGLERTARSVAEILARYEIPHLIVGGIAVQEHGYARVTLDVDVVVPDVLEAVEMLTADLSGPFRRVGGVEDRVEDRRNEVMVDLLPAGRVLSNGARVPFPEPRDVSDSPQVARLEELISLKLDSWRSTPIRRLRDKSDVIELIIQKNLPRELGLHPAVKDLYIELWDELSREKAR